MKPSMKKILIVVALIGLGAYVFNNDTSTTKKDTSVTKKFKAVTTFTVIADIARNVAGDAAIVESITKAGAEIHDYSPTPKDIIRAKGADVIFWNGMNLERWFERFLQDIKNVPSVVVSEGVQPMSIYEGPYTDKPNPHAWMSTKVALIYIENIRKTFVKMDPENKATYNKNARNYSNKVRKIRSKLIKTLSSIPKDKRYLVTSEGAFSYLAKDLNMKEVYLWPMNADQQGTPQQVRKVIDTVRKHHIPVVFSESTISDKPAKQVASETNAIYGGVLYVDSLSEKDGKVPTYLDLLKVTTSTIANGFKKALQEKNDHSHTHN
jgi:manganese/iron transport system substrate-binding protein